MTEILLSIAGITFGGGMIGQLIIFFTKRCDEKNETTNELLCILITNICEVQKTINDILGKIADANNQINILLQQQIDFLETTYDNERALYDALSALYKAPKNKNICKECIEIHNQYPRVDVEADKAERKSIRLNIYNETNEYIRERIKGLDIFPNLSSDFFHLKKSIKMQLLHLTTEYQGVYLKLRYKEPENNLQGQFTSADDNLLKLLGLLEQMKYILSNHIKH